MHKNDISFRPLWRMALISAPLIAAYSASSPFLFLSSITAYGEFDLPEFETKRLLFAMGMVCVHVTLLWALNITLLRWTLSRDPKLNLTLRLFISYLIVISFAFFAISIGGPLQNLRIGLMRYYPVIGSFTNNTFVLLLLHLLLRNQEKAQLQANNAALKMSELNTKLGLLIQQVQPHFLFNALGTLKILISKDPQKAEQYTGRLSGFLRNSLTTDATTLVSVKDEIERLEHYVTLQKMRFGEAFVYQNGIPEAFHNKKLPSFCLQTLAENALKHNSFSIEDPLLLKLDIQGDLLICHNTLSPLTSTEENTGLGLNNLTKRFVLLGGVAPEIQEDFDNQRFSVMLTPFS